VRKDRRHTIRGNTLLEALIVISIIIAMSVAGLTFGTLKTQQTQQVRVATQSFQAFREAGVRWADLNSETTYVNISLEKLSDSGLIAGSITVDPTSPYVSEWENGPWDGRWWVMSNPDDNLSFICILELESELTATNAYPRISQAVGALAYSVSLDGKKIIAIF
jgi:type II secretory pathway pseudopilin PulG